MSRGTNGEQEMVQALMETFYGINEDVISGEYEAPGSNELEAVLGEGDWEIQSFDEAGLLTGNDGVVIKGVNGRTFQITIVEA